MFIERHIVTRHCARDFDDSDNEKDNGGNYTVWVISKDAKEVKPYTYDEAIGLAGHGLYNTSLLSVCSLGFLGFVVDLFGFSAIVSGSACDLETGKWQHNVLLSMPFFGAMSSAYIWGYISDTQGRLFSLNVAMWGAFIFTTASAFSPHWIMLAILKFISVGFSSCAQSATFVLIGESCPVSWKNTYYCLMNSVVHFSIPIYSALSYVILRMSFSGNLGFVTFTPWRLLSLCLALPLGISAICLHFFYESPRFLANAGDRDLALKNLRGIWRRNKCVGKKYPVEKLILDEEGNAKPKNIPLLQSTWEQTVPLFRKPLLSRAMQLYFLNVVMYGTTNSLVVWFPFLVNAFIAGMSSEDVPDGMCKIIEHSLNSTDIATLSCIPKWNLTVVWVSFIQGLIFAIINISVSKVSNRRMVVVVMMMIICASSAGCAFIEKNIISLFLYFTLFMGMIVNGIVASYFVDFFPTSYRGMAACLSVLVSHVSSLVSINLTGVFIISHCSDTFYAMAVSVFCGVVAAWFLPSDKVRRLSKPQI